MTHLSGERQVALQRRAEERANQGGSMQELKPCPCCGSSNGLYVLQDEKYGEWSVFCDMCKTSFHNENHCDTREEAISAWNRRAERTCRIVLMDMAGNPHTGQVTGFSTRCLMGVQSAGIRSAHSTRASLTTVLTAGRVSSRRNHDNRLGAPRGGAEAAGEEE